MMDRRVCTWCGSFLTHVQHVGDFCPFCRWNYTFPERAPVGMYTVPVGAPKQLPPPSYQINGQETSLRWRCRGRDRGLLIFVAEVDQ